MAPIDIGSRLELFVDEFLIERMDRLSLQLHPPRRAEKVLEFNAPWEGLESAYVTIFKDGDIYRMYYRGRSSTSPECTCYAESSDGIQWNRPPLGIHEFKGHFDPASGEKLDIHEEFRGSKENNIIWKNGESKPPAQCHNFTPFLDANPLCPDGQRYKALAGAPMLALTSADGIRWAKMSAEPVITQGRFDSQNVSFWDVERGCYVVYQRVTLNDEVRGIARSTSEDFISWSEPQPINLGESPVEHLYTNATTPYFRAPHILLSFPKRFFPERKAVREHEQDGVSDGVMMTSRDGICFERQFMEAFLRPGRERQNWTQRSNMIACGVVPTAPDEISLYFSQHYSHPTAHLKRGVLRTDGMASVHAAYEAGELVTKPLLFEGDHLVINYETSGAGSLRVEVQDWGGNPIEGYTLADAADIYGDEIERVVSWNNKADIGQLAGRPARLRFVMNDAELYSMRFAPKMGMS